MKKAAILFFMSMLCICLGKAKGKKGWFKNPKKSTGLYFKNVQLVA